MSNFLSLHLMLKKKKTTCIFKLQIDFLNLLIHSACDTSRFCRTGFPLITLQLVVSVLFDSQQIGKATMHFYSTSHPCLSKNHWFSFLRGTTLLPIITLPGMKVTLPIWGGQGIHSPFTDNILESQLCPTDFPKLQNMWVPLIYDREILHFACIWNSYIVCYPFSAWGSFHTLCCPSTCSDTARLTELLLQKSLL